MSELSEVAVMSDQHLFCTWLAYRKSLGQTKAAVIREVNEKLGYKFDNKTYHNWEKQVKRVNKSVLKEFVRPDLPNVIKWYFARNEVLISDSDSEHFARLLMPEYETLPEVFQAHLKANDITVTTPKIEAIFEALIPSQR